MVFSYFSFEVKIAPELLELHLQLAPGLCPSSRACRGSGCSAPGYAPGSSQPTAPQTASLTLQVSSPFHK